MSYVDDVAAAIREEVPEESLPGRGTDDLFRIYAVLALAKGEAVELEDVHDAWAAWMSRHDPHHRSLRPLAELSPEVQASDQPYLDAIRKAARKLGLGR